MVTAAGDDDYSHILPHRGKGIYPTVITRGMFDAGGKYVGEPLPADPNETVDLVFESDLGEVEVPEIRTAWCIICGERTGLVIEGHLEADQFHGDGLPGECDEVTGHEIVRLRFGITAKTIKVGNIICGGDIVCEEITAYNITIGGSLITNKLNCKGWLSAQKGVRLPSK